MQSSSIQARENDPRFNSSYQYAKNLLKELSYIRDTVLRYSSCPEKIFAEEQMQSLMNLFDRALSLQKLMKMSHSMAEK
jgi:predicted KAP-like P-loop ATPase